MNEKTNQEVEEAVAALKEVIRKIDDLQKKYGPEELEQVWQAIAEIRKSRPDN
jgi:N-methylhydantoinase B/oxoprolinase/acetone carboxylase alpha subunit